MLLQQQNQEIQALTRLETQQAQEITVLSQEVGQISQELGMLLNAVESGSNTPGSTDNSNGGNTDPLIAQLSQSDPALAKVLKDAKLQMTPAGFAALEQFISQNKGNSTNDNSLMQQAIQRLENSNPQDAQALSQVVATDLGNPTTPPEVPPPVSPPGEVGAPTPPPEVQPPAPPPAPPPEVQPPAPQPTSPPEITPPTVLPTDGPPPSSSLGDANPPWDVGWNNAMIQTTGKVVNSTDADIAAALKPDTVNKMYSDVGMNVYAKSSQDGHLTDASFNFRNVSIVFDGSGAPHAIMKDGRNVPLDGSVPGFVGPDGSFNIVAGYLAPGVKNANGVQEKIEGALTPGALTPDGKRTYQVASGSTVFDMIPDGTGWDMKAQSTNLSSLYKQYGLDFPTPTGVLASDLSPAAPVPPVEGQLPTGAPPSELPAPSPLLSDSNPPWDVGSNNAMIQSVGQVYQSSDIASTLPPNQWSSLYSDVGMNVFGQPGNGDLNGAAFNFRDVQIVFNGSGPPHAIMKDGRNVPLDGSVPGVVGPDGTFNIIAGYIAPGVKNGNGVQEKIEGALTPGAVTPNGPSYQIASGSSVFDMIPNGNGGWQMKAQHTNLPSLYKQYGLDFPAPTGSFGGIG